MPNVDSLALHAILPGSRALSGHLIRLAWWCIGRRGWFGERWVVLLCRKQRDMMSRRGSGPFEFLRWRVTSGIPKGRLQKARSGHEPNSNDPAVVMILMQEREAEGI